jgi:hypothetical protein
MTPAFIAIWVIPVFVGIIVFVWSELRKPTAKHEACVSCHFFLKSFRPPKGRERFIAVSTHERDASRRRDFSWIGEKASICCRHSVWDEGHTPSAGEERFERIVTTNRKGFCFFLPFHPGMLLPAADKLQQRAAEQEGAARDRRLTLIGLWIAALGLAVGAIEWLVDFSLGRPRAK